MAALKSSAAPQISVALCTCDGASYLGRQLDSLLEQTYLPCELVVCDDASQDESISILESFASRAPFPVRIFRNPKRLGIGNNFEQAIRLCSGDAITLCDQDDIWLPNKLAWFAEMFAMGMDWACCNAEICNSELQPLGYTLWQRVHFDRHEQQVAREGRFFEILVKHYVVAGATLAFKTQVRDRLLPIPREWHYDAWLAAVLAATEKVGLSETALQHYRQHGGNAIGAIRRNLWHEAQAALAMDRRSHYIEDIARWEALATRLKELKTTTANRERVEAKIRHLLRRAALPANRLARLPVVMTEILNGNYARYARNWGSIALDLLVR